jgi:hypothetical protein
MQENLCSSKEISFSVQKESVLKPQIVRKPSFDDFQELGLLSESGKIRLLPAQRYFNENEDYSLLDPLYQAWRDEAEYIVFKHCSEGKTHYLGLKCSKRGNDVYNSRIRHRFKLFSQNLPDTKFFSTNPDAFKTDSKVKTNVLWVTLTWNTRLVSIRNAWKTEISEAWNRFITALRRRYGKIQVLRSWEATSQGYPHVHAVLWFESQEFTVFPHYSDKQKRLQFRIQEKGEFETLWHSYVDIEAISSIKKMANYVLKYQLKVNEGKEENGSGSQTLAHMWLFRKRSYACSKSLLEKFTRLDRDLHNSNMGNGGKWEFLGVFSGRDLGLNGQWIAEVDPLKLQGLLEDGDWNVDNGILNYD